MSSLSKDRSAPWLRWLLLPAAGLLAVTSVYAQAPSPGGQVSIPESSTEQPSDVGVRTHTNIQIFIPNQGADRAPAAPGAGTGSTALGPSGRPGSDRASGEVRQ
jgi:hypothetical protein